MNMLVFMLLSLSQPALAQDACGDPNASIMECPKNYLPRPMAPDAAAKSEVQALINAANDRALQDAEDKARDNWVAAKDAIEHPQNYPNDKRSREEKIKDYASKASVLRKVIDEKKARYQAAINKAIEVYHLVPPQTDFSSDERLNYPWRKARPWPPQYSEAEVWDQEAQKYRRRTKAELQQEHDENAERARQLGLSYIPGPTAADTKRESGDIAVFQEAFKGDSDRLAEIITHETWHWVAAASRQNNRVLADQFQSEASAYAYQADFLKRLGKSQSEIAAALALSEQYAKQAEDARSWRLTQDDMVTNPTFRNWLKCSAGQAPGSAADPGEPEQDKSEGNAGFYNGLDGLKDISRDSEKMGKDILDRQEREREEKERLRWKAEEAWLRHMLGEDAASVAAWHYLKKMAGLACSNPDAVAAQAAQGNVVSLNGAEQGVMFRIFQADDAVGWKSLALSPCQLDVLDRVGQKLEARAPVFSTDLADWAEGYRMTHPSLLERFATSAGEFLQALGELLQSRGSSGGSGGGRSEPRENNGGGSRCLPRDPDTGIIGCCVSNC